MRVAIALLSAPFALDAAAHAHPPDSGGLHGDGLAPTPAPGPTVTVDASRLWTVASTGRTWRGSFLASVDGFVTIAKDTGGTVRLAEWTLATDDRAYVARRNEAIRAINEEFAMRAMQSPPASCSTPPGAGASMIESFSPFRPEVRFYWDATAFYVEGDSMPNAALMPSIMVGITSWQQQIPVPTAYFGNITNPEANTGSLGYGKPNVWKLPLVAVPAASPISLSGGNFQRGAVALAANGIPIFNPRNNTGQFSYAIGELDVYGGHCGRADDYHYHIAPVHLQSVLGVGKPVAWALDGYPIYGYTEPDGTPRLALDADGGHSHGSWGYHYHAIGSASTGPQSPYLMNAFHGTVVNFGGQVDPQPSAFSFAAAGTPLAGAVILASSRPSTDAFSMIYRVGTVNYTVSYTVNRTTRTIQEHWEGPTGTTNPSYVNSTRFYPYQLASKSIAHVPDTGQTTSATETFGEDSDYTVRPPSFTDNGNGTVTDNVTGLMWQKTDSGEMTWESAVAGALTLNLGGFADWRLPTPLEAFSILNHDRNPALDPAVFSNPASSVPQYWWTNDFYANDATRVWVTNSGGGIGPHPKTETISAGGTARFHARYVRGAKPTLSHNYANNLDGTITDLDAGLMWTQAPSPTALSWTGAIQYAESLTTAGYTDWRLPTVKELESLVDITQATATTTAAAKTAINRTLFPSVTPTAYWSATALNSGTLTSSWLVEFGVNTAVPPASGPNRGYQGLASYELQTAVYPALAVRSLLAAPCACLADLDGSGSVDAADLAILLGSWGTATATTTADLNLDGVVNAADLAIMLGAWGGCQ
jgi:hypothetical protein